MFFTFSFIATDKATATQQWKYPSWH